MHDLLALLPMKARSERIENKNFREFNGKMLFQWILEALLSVEEIEKVVINTDARGGLYSGGTVTYTALQIIYHMGFRKVIIIGLDHNYREKGTPGKTEVRDQRDDESHFHTDYFPRGTKWQLPDLRRSEIAFKLAKLAFEADGREIIDATIDGQCEVFEKGDFYMLVSSDLGTTK